MIPAETTSVIPVGTARTEDVDPLLFHVFSMCCAHWVYVSPCIGVPPSLIRDRPLLRRLRQHIAMPAELYCIRAILGSGQ